MIGIVKYNFPGISSNYETVWSGIVKVDPRLDPHF